MECFLKAMNRLLGGGEQGGPPTPKAVFPLLELSLRPALGSKRLPSCLSADSSPMAAVQLSVDRSSMNSHFLSGAASGVFISASAPLLSGSSFSQVLVRGGRGVTLLPGSAW